MSLRKILLNCKNFRQKCGLRRPTAIAMPGARRGGQVVAHPAAHFIKLNNIPHYEFSDAAQHPNILLTEQQFHDVE